MSFFIDNNCLIPQNQTRKTKNILLSLYNEIVNGVSYINDVKQKLGNSFYKLKIDIINNISQIPKPKTFPPNAFPKQVRNHIDDNSLGLLTYTFHLFGRNINIFFLTEDNEPENLIDVYNGYVDYMLVWLYIIDMNSSRSCASNLKIYIYHTKLLKILPHTNIEILNENNVNTAFTRTCPSNSEIVVFRKEEWFKVFMHETFHNFGLDFSIMNHKQFNEKILQIFPLQSEVNLFESYAEFWARIMNVLFCSYINLTNKNNVNEFLENAEIFLNFEIIFSFFQVVKILDFIGLNYSDLYEKNNLSKNLRDTLYKEDTNVLSYYIITLILINNYQDFLSWCNINNTSLIDFKKTYKNIDNYCKFIETKYKQKSLLKGINCTDELLIGLKKINNKTKLKSKRDEITYLIQNLRMTICELD